MNHERTLLCGGCLRKTSRGVTTLAPSMAAASVIVLGAVLSMVSPARAVSCSTLASGESECTGVAGSFDLSTLSSMDPLSGFSKVGSGTWTLSGEIPDGSELSGFHHGGGTLVLADGANVKTTAGAGGQGTVADFILGRGTTLRVDGSATIAADVIRNSEGSGDLGRITFDENRTGTLTIAGDFEPGGDIDLNIDFSNQSAPASSKLIIQGDLVGTETSAINLRAIGNVPRGAHSFPETIIVMGDSRADGFETGEAIMGAFAFQVEFSGADDSNVVLNARTLTSSGAGRGMLVIPMSFSHRATTFEAYPAVLTSLASLESLRQSRSGRSWSDKPGVGFWGKTDVKVSEIESKNSVTYGSYDITDSRVRFGVDVPVADRLTLGASVAIGTAAADTSSETGGGSIESELFAGGADFSWVGRNFYADTRFQYTSLTSDITTPGEVVATGSDAALLSASGEVGYHLDVGSFGLIPSAQLIWSEVDFDDFTGPSSEAISMVDGENLTTRIGIAADSNWSEGNRRGQVHAGLDLRIPLDGETVVDVSGVNLVSGVEAPMVEIGFGMDYGWDDRYSVSGNLGLSRGDEVSEIRASVGIRVGF